MGGSAEPSPTAKTEMWSTTSRGTVTGRHLKGDQLHLRILHILNCYALGSRQSKIIFIMKYVLFQVYYSLQTSATCYDLFRYYDFFCNLSYFCNISLWAWTFLFTSRFHLMWNWAELPRHSNTETVPAVPQPVHHQPESHKDAKNQLQSETKPTKGEIQSGVAEHQGGVQAFRKTSRSQEPLTHRGQTTTTEGETQGGEARPKEGALHSPLWAAQNMAAKK